MKQDEPPIRNFPVFFYQIRNEIGWNRKQMASALKLTPQQVYYIELGRDIPEEALERFKRLLALKCLLVPLKALNFKIGEIRGYFERKITYLILRVNGHLVGDQLTLGCYKQFDFSEFVRLKYVIKTVIPYLVIWLCFSQIRGY